MPKYFFNHGNVRMGKESESSSPPDNGFGNEGHGFAVSLSWAEISTLQVTQRKFLISNLYNLPE